MTLSSEHDAKVFDESCMLTQLTSFLWLPEGLSACNSKLLKSDQSIMFTLLSPPPVAIWGETLLHAQL
jgi:hypothetical protein